MGDKDSFSFPWVQSLGMAQVVLGLTCFFLGSAAALRPYGAGLEGTWIGMPVVGSGCLWLVASSFAFPCDLSLASTLMAAATVPVALAVEIWLFVRLSLKPEAYLPFLLAETFLFVGAFVLAVFQMVIYFCKFRYSLSFCSGDVVFQNCLAVPHHLLKRTQSNLSCLSTLLLMVGIVCLAVDVTVKSTYKCGYLLHGTVTAIPIIMAGILGMSSANSSTPALIIATAVVSIWSALGIARRLITVSSYSSECTYPEVPDIFVFHLEGFLSLCGFVLTLLQTVLCFWLTTSAQITRCESYNEDAEQKTGQWSGTPRRKFIFE